MTVRIPLSVPCLPATTASYVQECLDTNFVSSVGPFVERFESQFAAQVGAAHAVACSSGTAALHLALLLSGASPGVEVAVSTFTFIASVNAIRYTGATPLLVDSEWSTWNLNGSLLHDEVRKRARLGRPLPALIEAVHVLGQPCDMEPLLVLRDEFDITIVEDAAEALGASYRSGTLAGRQVGTIGRFGCLSFNGNKILTTGGGGMVLTAEEALARRVRHLSTQAKVPGGEYEHDEIGFNYRMTNVAAAIGLAQLEVLDQFLEKKAAIASRYRQELAGLRLEFPPEAPWALPSSWLFSVLVENKEVRISLLKQLAGQGIEARPLWLPAHCQRTFQDASKLGGEVAEDLHGRGVSLPSSVGLSEDEQGRVIDAVRRILA